MNTGERPPKKAPAEAGAAPSGIKLLTPPEEYARIAQEQRAWIRGMADRIERGESLEHQLDNEVAAGILRARANQISDKEPRGRGQAPRIDAGNVAIHYACLVNGGGMGKTEAIAKLADGNGVSIEAIKKAIKKYGDAAMRMIPQNPNLKKK